MVFLFDRDSSLSILRNRIFENYFCCVLRNLPCEIEDLNSALDWAETLDANGGGVQVELSSFPLVLLHLYHRFSYIS